MKHINMANKIKITESQLHSILELDYNEFRQGENLSALRDALNKNIIVGVAFVKKDGSVRHMSIKKTLGSYIPSTSEKTDKQLNVGENTNTKRVVDVNAYIKALKNNGGDKEQAASVSWRTLYYHNVLGFIVGARFFDLRDENNILERFGEDIYNSLTKSMVKAIELQLQQNNNELEVPEVNEPENIQLENNKIKTNKKNMKKIVRIKESKLNNIIHRIIKEQNGQIMTTGPSAEQMTGTPESDNEPISNEGPNFEEFVSCAKELLDQGVTIGNLIDQLLDAQESEPDSEEYASDDDDEVEPEVPMNENRRRR